LKAPDTNYNAVVNQIWNDSKILPAAYNALLKGSGSLGELKSRQIKTQLSDSLAQFSAISPKIVDVVQTMNALNKNVEWFSRRRTCRNQSSECAKLKTC